MDGHNPESLEQQVATLKATIEQQGKRLADQHQAMQAQGAQLKKLKGELISQDHRFITAWSTLIHTIAYKDDREHFRDALKAVLFLFVPGTKSTIVLGASLVGVLTLVLMFQSNQLTAQQNAYFQQQIRIQAESDRRDQMVNIMEKLYEPTEASLKARQEFDALPAKEREAKTRPVLQPKYNAQTRTQSVLGYLNIQHQPLEKENPATLPALPQMGSALWASLGDFTHQKVEPETKDAQVCETLSDEILESVNLHLALLNYVYLPKVCLSKADLILANLHWANLADANLHWANLTAANLTDADLRGANLTNAKLRGANLERADLRGANLERADLVMSKNLTCEQLTRAENWEKALADLKCDPTVAVPIVSVPN